GDVADHARRARRQGRRGLSLLYGAGLEHGGRAYHPGEQAQGGRQAAGRQGGGQDQARGRAHEDWHSQRGTMKICGAGQGAFGQKHLDALKRIPEVEVTSLVGGNQDATAEIAKKYGIPHYTGDLSEGIKRADAVILTTPTKMHFRQGEQVMRAGKHVLVEIPITDSVE